MIPGSPQQTGKNSSTLSAVPSQSHILTAAHAHIKCALRKHKPRRRVTPKSLKISDGQNCSRIREPGELLGSSGAAEDEFIPGSWFSLQTASQGEQGVFTIPFNICCLGQAGDKGAALNMQEAGDKGAISQTCPLLCGEANSPAREPSAKRQNYLASLQNPYSTQVTDSMAGKANGAINTNLVQ